MASVTLPRRAHCVQSIRENLNHQHCSSDEEDANSILTSQSQWPTMRPGQMPRRTASYNERRKQPPPPVLSQNRFKEMCSKLKRRLTLTKEHRTQSEDIRGSLVERRRRRFGNYKSFSSSIDDECFDEFEWPDFEKVYDSIPSCLINALPGLDDFTLDEDDAEEGNDRCQFNVDESEQVSSEHMNSFALCKRGQNFRRHGICQKLDKSQYRGQLDTFIQQLMIEKLMRTWS